MNQLETQPPVQPAPATAATTPGAKSAAPAPVASKPAAPPPPKAQRTVQTFPALQGPPVAISAEKQQRLDTLLRKYRADELTPEEYHLQRAKVLAEP